MEVRDNVAHSVRCEAVPAREDVAMLVSMKACVNGRCLCVCVVTAVNCKVVTAALLGREEM